MTSQRRIVVAAVAALVLGLAPLLGASAAAASTRSDVRADVSDFTFSSFSADYYLSREASGRSELKTVEKLTAVFPSFDQNKGIERKIPDTYRGANLHTKLVAVSDTNGVTKPYSVTDSGDYTTVATGTDAYVHGSVTYTLTYTQENVVGEFANTGDQELYWDTNGTGWNQPFGSLVARVHIDPSLVGALTGHNACYRGAQGSKDTCAISSDGASPLPATGSTPAPTGTPVATVPPEAAEFAVSTTHLDAGENVTFAIGFTDGTFTGAANGTDSGIDDHAAKLSDPPWGEVVGALLALLGLAGLPVALIRRFAFGQRDAKGRGIIVAQYDAPTGMNLMEAASLVKRESTAIPAQLVSFAVRGNIRILDYPVTDSGANFTLELLKVDGLDPEERTLISGFFPGLKPGATFEIVQYGGPAAQVDAAKAEAHANVVQRGWRAKASSRSGVITGLALLALVILEVIFSVVLAVAASSVSVLTILAIPVTFVSMIVAFAVARRGFVLTPAGADQRDYLLGMQVYMKLAEQDRMRMLQSPTGAERVDYGDNREVVKLNEKLLPYAVLFGIEDEWSKVLAIHYAEGSTTPDWWVSSNAFNSALFASSLSGLSGSVAQSVAPMPTTSGGGSSFGGSFGGGFSGGGGGGGGGGGR